MGPFCCVLHQFGVALLRPAAIWGSFAASCSDLVSFCCVLQRFGVVLLRSASIRRGVTITIAGFAASSVGGSQLRRNCGAIVTPLPTTQQNAPQINAERSKTPPKLMQNAAKLPQINAERSKTAANRCRTLILWRMSSFSRE